MASADTMISAVRRSRTALLREFEGLIETNARLDRTLVSFQANRKARFFELDEVQRGIFRGLVDYLHRSRSAVLVEWCLTPLQASERHCSSRVSTGCNAHRHRAAPGRVLRDASRGLAAERVDPASFRKEFGRSNKSIGRQSRIGPKGWSTSRSRKARSHRHRALSGT